MPNQIAFLRAINVGGHTVKMDVLRDLFSQMGLANISTFIASGNVLFDTPLDDPQGLELEIEKQLGTVLGYAVTTFLRSPNELRRIASHDPFANEDWETAGHRVHVGFLKREPDEAAQQKLFRFHSPVDEFAVVGRELYWLCRIRVSESTFSGAALEKALGMPATLRNITTVRKIAALVS